MLYSDENLEGCEIERESLPTEIQEWSAIDEHIDDLRKTEKRLIDERWQMRRMMEDDSFDGPEDFDPLASVKQKQADNEYAIEGNQRQLEALESKFSPEAKAIHQTITEYACECARDRAEERRVRRAEDGWRE